MHGKLQMLTCNFIYSSSQGVLCQVKNLVKNIQVYWLYEHCVNPFNYQCTSHIETSQLICRAYQWTGFYMRGTLVVKGLKEATWWLYALQANDSLLYPLKTLVKWNCTRCTEKNVSVWAEISLKIFVFESRFVFERENCNLKFDVSHISFMWFGKKIWNKMFYAVFLKMSFCSQKQAIKLFWIQTSIALQYVALLPVN